MVRAGWGRRVLVGQERIIGTREPEAQTRDQLPTASHQELESQQATCGKELRHPDDKWTPASGFTAIGRAYNAKDPKDCCTVLQNNQVKQLTKVSRNQQTVDLIADTPYFEEVDWALTTKLTTDPVNLMDSEESKQDELLKHDGKQGE
ncbi:unnamed protein product [Caretta caretta]